MIVLPKTIRMVITDFDGIVTDNCVYIDSECNMSRKLNYKDIMAFSLLKKNDIKVIKDKFQIEEVHQGIRNKLEVLEAIIQRYSLTQEDYVYIGDDVNDLKSLMKAKYAITVPDAVQIVKDVKGIQVTHNKGGTGAFREVVDVLLDNLQGV